MKHFLKRLYIVAVVAILLTACTGNSTSKIVGTWYSQDAYSYRDSQGMYYCSQFIFSDASTYYDGDLKAEKFIYSDTQLEFLSGDNRGWDLEVVSLSKDTLKLIGSDFPNDKGVETFVKLPEIKDFESFLNGVWVLKDANGEIDTVFEFENGRMFYDGDPYPIQLINGNTIIIFDYYDEVLFVKKINNNKAYIYDGCLSESAEVVFERVD